MTKSQLQTCKKNNRIKLQETCKSPKGVKIIGELAAKYWLLQKQISMEGNNAKRIHGDDADGAEVQ